MFIISLQSFEIFYKLLENNFLLKFLGNGEKDKENIWMVNIVEK